MDVREVLERRPASTVVVQLIYKKFVRKDRARNAPTQVLCPETVELPIERGLAGPGMLADTIVRRWQDHQPLNRLEDIYSREGLDLAKSTLCTWHEALADLARPLVDAMRQEALAEPYLCVDATGVLVQAKEKCRAGHFCVLVAPEKHVLYGFSKQHNGAAVDELLGGYQGYLVADAHAVYNHFYEGGDVIEVGCWAHARRYFFKALASDPERAKVALSHIGALFRIERTIADSPRNKKEQVRRAKSRPIVDNFFQWCEFEAERVLDESPVSTAIGYARNQRVASGQEKLAFRRQRRRRARKHRLRFPARERPHAPTRSPGLPARPVLPVAELAEAPPARTRPRLLAKDSRAARGSTKARSQRLPSRFAFAAVLSRASLDTNTAPRARRRDGRDRTLTNPGRIDKIATGAGLVPKGPNPAGGKGAYVDPVTGKQRVLVHPEGASPHAHVNDPLGNRLGPDGSLVQPESPEAHLPITIP